MSIDSAKVLYNKVGNDENMTQNYGIKPILKFNKRIKFTNPDGRINNKITFQLGYICCDFLHSDLIIEALI